MVECHLAKVDVEGSSPFSRSSRMQSTLSLQQARSKRLGRASLDGRRGRHGSGQRVPRSTTRSHLTSKGGVPTIIILTVNRRTTEAVLDAFVGTRRRARRSTQGRDYVQPARYPRRNGRGPHCERDGSRWGRRLQQRTRDAIDHWNPVAVVAVGVAFGLDESKQRIADVMVATQIQGYDLAKVNDDGTITPRSDRPRASDVICDRIRQATSQARTKARRGHLSNVTFGLVLSGQKLVDNLNYRESLRTLFPEALGGEMEAIGVYSSAHNSKVDWAIVKAVCDWGHNKANRRKEVWQQRAARAAARTFKAALDLGPLYPAKPHEPHADGAPDPSASPCPLELPARASGGRLFWPQAPPCRVSRSSTSRQGYMRLGTSWHWEECAGR